MKSSKRASLIAAILGLTATSALADAPQVNHAEKHIHTTSTAYDAVGNVVTSTGGGTISYNYDAQGNRSSTSGGNTITYTYDALDRATSPSGPPSYTYEEIGNDSTTSGGNTTSSTYDTNGNSITDHDTLGNTIQYQYNSTGGGTTTETDPGGRTTTYTYDPTYHSTEVTGNDPLGNTITYQYDTSNNRILDTDAISGVNNSNNTDTMSSGSVELSVTTRYQYDAHANIVTHSAGSSANVTLYDETGNTVIFQYDANTPDALGNTTTYQYDPVGGANMGTLTGPLEGTLLEGHIYRYSYSYDVNQQLAQTGNGNLSLTLNLTALPEPSLLAPAAIVASAMFHRRRHVLATSLFRK
jgi:YD repeat-containing protein